MSFKVSVHKAAILKALSKLEGGKLGSYPVLQIFMKLNLATKFSRDRSRRDQRR